MSDDRPFTTQDVDLSAIRAEVMAMRAATLTTGQLLALAEATSNQETLDGP